MNQTQNAISCSAEGKKEQKKPLKYISVFNKPAGQQLPTPAIGNWILVARNCLDVA